MSNDYITEILALEKEIRALEKAGHDQAVRASVAEQEADQLRAEVERLRKHMPCSDGWMSAMETAADDFRKEADQLRAQLAAAQTEIKTLQEAFKDRVYCIEIQAEQKKKLSEALKVAREALLKILYEIGVKTDGVCGDTVISTYSIVNPMRFAQDCQSALRRIEELTNESREASPSK